MAQLVDKLQTQINTSALKIDPTNEKYTLGVFWRNWGRTVKIFVGTFLPSIIFLWAVFTWWNSIETSFKDISNSFVSVNDKIDSLDDTLSINQGHMEAIINSLYKKTPENVSSELLDFRRTIVEDVSNIDKKLEKLERLEMIDKELDLIYDLVLNSQNKQSLDLIPLLFMDEINDRLKEHKNEEIEYEEESPSP